MPRGLSASSMALTISRSEALLRLQPLGEGVDRAGELGQADDALGREIADMRPADEGHHVVLAMGEEGDVADEHDVVVAADLLEGAAQRIFRPLVVAGVELAVGIGDAARRVDEPSRLGSSPAQAISVRTAASASSRLGRLPAAARSAWQPASCSRHPSHNSPPITAQMVGSRLYRSGSPHFEGAGFAGMAPRWKCFPFGGRIAGSNALRGLLPTA